MKKKLLQLTKSISLAAFIALLAPPADAEEAFYYSTDFNCSKLSDINFTAIDGNGDGVTWKPRTSTVNYYYIDGVKYDTPVQYSPTMIAGGNHNDWLITPGIGMEAGKTYKVKFAMCKNYFVSEENVFEIKLGTDKTAAAMTTELIPVSTLPQGPGNNIFNFTATVQVPADGDYYIGIHATGASTNGFGIAKLEIEKGVSMISPNAVTDLTITPDANGLKKAVLSFKAPSTAKDGSALTSLSYIEIRRNGDLDGRIDNPTPGAQLSYTSQVAVNGLYTYTVTAYTASGAGDPASVTTFVGVNIPAPATDLIAANTSNTSAHISWAAPILDKDGYPVVASALKYDLYRRSLSDYEWELVAADLTALSYDDTVTLEAGTQTFFNYGVTAKTSQGAASQIVSEPVPMGTPYPMPYAESFVNGRASTIVTSTEVDGHTMWYQTRDIEDISSSDADNGMILLMGALNGGANLNLGLIDITSQSPVLTFYTFNINDPAPANTIKVVVTATDGTTKTFDEYAPADFWNKTILRLDDFVGKSVRINFIGRRNSLNDLMLDNINVSEIFRHDLMANGITVPAEAHSDEAFDVKVDVLNAGSEPSGAYTVELLCDGESVGTYSGSNLAVGAHDIVTFNRTHDIQSAEEVTYVATIIYAEDQDKANNTTEPVKVKVMKNSYPVVTDLTGQVVDGKVKLSWSEPDTSKAQPYAVVEDFESYPSWATSGVGNWTFVDVDKAQIAGFSEINMPGIPDYSQQSWWVFDGAAEDFNNGSFATLSGHKFLASMVSGISGQGYVQNDDWAISPELYGGPQKITINARSYSMMDLESFEVLYSTGSLDPADFISLGTNAEVPYTYQAYEVNLPDGAKHFAIRNISLGKYILMVDDVKYIPAGDPAAFSINGYNVYRDGSKINIDPVEECEFTDTEFGQDNHNYNVSVLYSAGESQLSNTWNPTGVGTAEVEASAMKVYTAGDAIVVEGATAPVTIYTADGRQVASFAAASMLRWPAQPGIYIVASGNTTSKVIVR